METPYDRLAREIERLGDERHAIGLELDEAKAQAEGLGEFAAQVMAERDTARAALAQLREVARALLDALLVDDGPSVCEDCNQIATHVLVWELDSECLCDRHAAEQIGDDMSPVEVQETVIAAPLRALRAILEGGSQ